MPIYEFECLDCQHSFETIVKSSNAAADVSCPNCKKNNVKKTISAGSYRLNSSSAGSAPCSSPPASCPAKGGFR